MIVIGGGPAGYTAALYGARVRAVAVGAAGPDARRPGGHGGRDGERARLPEGIGGQALAARMREQAEASVRGCAPKK